MNNSAEKILYRKAALIFEELGFLMPRPENGSGSRKDGSTSAVVSFNGPFSGYLLVSLSADVMSQLSSNMLVDEEASSETLQQDSLREIANVICGNALPAIYGFEPIFHLDAPSMSDGTEFASRGIEYSQAAQVHISFDVGHAAISLFVESSAADSFPTR